MTDGEAALTKSSEPPADANGHDVTPERASFTYAPPPALECVLQMATMPAHRKALASETTNDHVLFRISPSDSAADTLAKQGENVPRLNLAVVIDRSGSMDGLPLEQAKRACSTLLDQLGADDLLTVVSYAETADLIVPAKRVVNKALIRESLGRIKSGSTTNLLQALRLAAQQLIAVKDRSTINRIFLVTDGEPAAGVKEYAAIMSQASELAARGITISTFGLGADYEEELLAGLAERAGGNYSHVAEPGQIADSFERELRKVRRVSARNLRFRLHPARGVNILRVYGHDAIYAPRSVEIALSDLERDTTMELVCELEFTQRSPANYRVATAELLYDDVGTLRPERLACDLRYEFVAESESIPATEDPGTIAAVEVVAAMQVLDMTLLAIRRQGLDAEAVQSQLHRVETTLRERDRGAEAERVASARTAIDRGVPMPKVMMNTVFDLNQGKTS